MAIAGAHDADAGPRQGAAGAEAGRRRRGPTWSAWTTERPGPGGCLPIGLRRGDALPARAAAPGGSTARTIISGGDLGAPGPAPGALVEYLIKQYALESGALEIQYIEEFFGEFPRRKTAQGNRRAAARSRIADPDGRSAAAGRPRHAGAGVVQGRARDPARGDRCRSCAIWSTASTAPCSSTAARSSTVDRRDPPRLARPGPFPRPHRAVRSVGASAGLRGSRRQDQEPLLRHARRCSRSCSSTSSSTSRTRSDNARVEGLSQQAAACRNGARSPQRAHRRHRGIGSAMAKPPIETTLVWQDGLTFRASTAHSAVTFDSTGAVGPSPPQMLAIARRRLHGHRRRDDPGRRAGTR